MWEAYYGKEPFDLRLTVLRLIRNLNMILIWTVLGTLLFGGGYYVKNVLLGPAPAYSVTSTYKVQYVTEPTQSGDYYINEATWDSLVHTEAFLSGVQKHLEELTAGNTAAGASAENFGADAAEKVSAEDTAAEDIAENVSEKISAEEWSTEALSAVLTANLPSDWHVPTTTVVTEHPDSSMLIAAAVELTMEQEFIEMMGSEVASVRVLNPGTTVEEVLPDVRPARAFVLSAVLSLFFVMVIFLLKETGDDSIWLPATLRRRYGLPVLGTIESAELAENVKYLFRDKKRIAVCSVDERVNPAEAAAKIAAGVQAQKKHPDESRKESCEEVIVAEESKLSQEWIPVPTPLLSPETCGTLREMDGILLVVKAGAHAGKPLEYVKEMLEQQDCKITAVILWEADEKLIQTYYFGRKYKRSGEEKGERI